MADPDLDVAFPERVPGPRMSALPSELQPRKPREPRDKPPKEPAPKSPGKQARKTDRQLMVPKTGLVYADWGTRPSPMRSLWKQLVDEYRLAAHYWRFAAKGGPPRIVNVAYGDEDGVWWRYFPSKPEAFDATNADLDDPARELGFHHKYAPFFWSALERLYHRMQFVAVDEVASVMCNPLFEIASALSEEMVKRVRDEEGIWFYEGRGVEARREVEAYGREMAGWIAGFLGVPVTMRNVMAATPHLTLYEDVVAPVLQRARTCPVPRPPAYSYGCTIPLIGMGRLSNAQRELFVRPGSKLRKVSVNGAVHMMKELGWPKDDGGVFKRNVVAMGVYVPEVMFGTDVLDVDVMRGERTTPYARAWAMLGALALDSLSARFSVGRAFLASESRSQATHPPNFDPSLYANVNGSAVRADDTSYAADGMLFTVPVGEDPLGMFGDVERINMYTFGGWLQRKIAGVYAVTATTSPTSGGLRAACAITCMERFAIALKTPAYDVVWWQPGDERKMNKTVEETVNDAPMDEIKAARRTMDRLGELMALVACAVVRCGLEVWVVNDKKDKGKMMVVVGGNPACALMQGKVYANVAFMRPSKKESGPDDARRAGKSSVQDGDGETPTVDVRAAGVMQGTSEKGRYVRLGMFSWRNGETRRPGSDVIVAHERGPVLEVPEKRTGSRSAAGPWGARWTQWKSLGIFGITLGSGPTRVVFRPVLHPWKSGMTVLDEPMPPAIGDARALKSDEFVVEPYDAALYTLYHAGWPKEEEWKRMWASVTKAMSSPLTSAQWRLLRKEVPKITDATPHSRLSEPVKSALERLGQTFGFVDPVRTMLAVLTKPAGSIGSYDPKNIDKLDVRTAENLVKRQPAWAAASVGGRELPGGDDGVPSVWDYLVPLTKRVERKMDDGSVLAWNYYVDLAATKAEVFVCDVCVSGPAAYWQEAWRASAGANRMLFGRGLAGVEKFVGPAEAPGTTFANLVPRADPSFDTDVYDEAVSVHGTDVIKTPSKVKHEGGLPDDKCSILARAADALESGSSLGVMASELRRHLADVTEMYKRVQTKRAELAGITRPLNDVPEMLVKLVKLEESSLDIPDVPDSPPRISGAPFEDDCSVASPPAGAAYVWDHDIDYYASRVDPHVDLDDVDF